MFIRDLYQFNYTHAWVTRQQTKSQTTPWAKKLMFLKCLSTARGENLITRDFAIKPTYISKEEVVDESRATAEKRVKDVNRWASLKYICCVIGFQFNDEHCRATLCPTREEKNDFSANRAERKSLNNQCLANDAGKLLNEGDLKLVSLRKWLEGNLDGLRSAILTAFMSISPTNDREVRRSSRFSVECKVSKLWV